MTDQELRSIEAMAHMTIEDLQAQYKETSEIMQRVRSKAAYDLNAAVLEAYSKEIQRRRGEVPSQALFFAR
jgi:DNA topoisomerase VI subunit A